MRTHFSIAELLNLNVSALPSSKSGLIKRIQSECWPFVEVAGKGGRNGKRREYTPPPDVMKQIQARKLEEALGGLEDLPSPTEMEGKPAVRNEETPLVLPDATLDKLNAAVAAARDKMAALKDEAADTVAQLQTELARLRGDGEQARRLEEERKLRELNLKLAEAEAQGNGEAAARYRQAVSLQRQIYRERAEQEEQAEKARAEKPQAGLTAAFEAAPPQIGIPLSDLQRLIEARDKRVAEAAAESVIAGLEAAFRRTV